MGIQVGLTASEIRNGKLSNNYYGAPVNNVQYSLSPNFLYAQVANEEHYAAKTAGLAVGSSITIFAGAPLGFLLNMLLVRVSATTEIQLINGATVLLDDLAVTNVLCPYDFKPQGLVMPEVGNPLTLKNVAGAAADFYVSAYWCRF